MKQAEQARWMLEEFYVSLWAQELGKRGRLRSTVSRKRWRDRTANKSPGHAPAHAQAVITAWAVRGRLGNRNRKRNRRHGPINALKRSWRKANWPTRIKMVLIPTVAVVVVVALVAGLVRFTNWRAQVRAAEAAQLELTRTYDFNPGNIISDGQFFNGSAMSQAEVQSFLDTQGGSLAAMTFDTSNESGEGLCADYTGTKGESAAAIIDQSARACKG